MSKYSLSHLSDGALLRALADHVAQERASTAVVLAHIAEVDARKLYLPAAYPSMYAYCVGELRLSEQAALKRIHVARLARRFPQILDAVATGGLHLSALTVLSPFLTDETADELLSIASHKSKSELECLLAERFPRTELLALVDAMPSADSEREARLAPERVDAACQLSPGRVEAVSQRDRLSPIAPERFSVHLTIGQETHDLLREAEALLSHQVDTGDIAGVIHTALDLLVVTLRRRKFAATTRPHRVRRKPGSPRHIPASVKRAVWERDGGQCTFVGTAGKRCDSRARLEFDHAQEVARGGQATAANIRLRCRAHNQYAAECTFGTEFMRQKRAAAQRAAAATRQRASEVIPWLRQLGFRETEARRAAAHCESIPDAPLEKRVHTALRFLAPGGVRHG